MQYIIYNKDVSENVFIALPALGERKEMYEKLAERLPNYKIISFDLPGHNGYLPEDVSIRNFTTNLHKQLKELGIKKAHFMGNSIGAWIIQDYYNLYPNDVDSLWLLDGGHFFEAKIASQPIELPITDRLEVITATIETLTKELSNPADSHFFKNYFIRNFTFQDNLYTHHANEGIVNSLAKEIDTTNFCTDTFTIPTFIYISEENYEYDEYKLYVSNFEKKHNLKAIIINNSKHYLPLTNSKDVAELIQKQLNVMNTF